MNIDVSSFADEIAKQMNTYTEEVTEELEQVIQEDAKILRDELKSTSPVKTGDYKKGWRVKKVKQNGHYTAIVHNATNYQLTHLLEKGHAKKGGVGRVKAYPHIGSAEEKIVPKFLNDVEEILKG